MSGNTAIDCQEPQPRARLALVTFGEPRACTHCGRALEFSRKWQRITLATQLFALVALSSVAIQTQVAVPFWLSLPVLALLQVLFWWFAPVLHQSPTAVQRRNRFYLAAAISLLLFAICLFAWVIRTGP